MVGLIGRGISPSQGRYLHTEHKHRKTPQISMPGMGFEPTIEVLEGTNIVYALDRTATVIGLLKNKSLK
jgi:hypothetical protein